MPCWNVWSWLFTGLSLSWWWHLHEYQWSLQFWWMCIWMGWCCLPEMYAIHSLSHVVVAFIFQQADLMSVTYTHRNTELYSEIEHLLMNHTYELQIWWCRVCLGLAYGWSTNITFYWLLLAWFTLFDEILRLCDMSVSTAVYKNKTSKNLQIMFCERGPGVTLKWAS